MVTTITSARYATRETSPKEIILHAFLLGKSCNIVWSTRVAVLSNVCPGQTMLTDFVLQINLYAQYSGNSVGYKDIAE